MTKLITEYDATNEVWFAYDEAREDGRAIGQGWNPESASSDYWYQARGSAAELVHDVDRDCWKLEEGCYSVDFDTKREAVAFANANDWQIKGRL